MNRKYSMYLLLHCNYLYCDFDQFNAALMSINFLKKILVPNVWTHHENQIENMIFFLYFKYTVFSDIVKCRFPKWHGQLCVYTL